MSLEYCNEDSNSNKIKHLGEESYKAMLTKTNAMKCLILKMFEYVIDSLMTFLGYNIGVLFRALITKKALVPSYL